MFRHELSLPLLISCLLAAGLITLSSAAPEPSFLTRQSLFLVLAVALATLILFLGRERIMRLAYPLYGLSMGLLVLTQLFGTEINGAKSWLYVGPLPGFQPSELAKISLILALASWLQERPIKNILSYFIPVVLMVLPFGLVFLEPDLGGALVLLAIGAGMLLLRGIPWQHWLIACALLGLATPTVIWPNLQPHQRARLTTFVNPEADSRGSGYQVIQSRIAIGSGGLRGKGYKQGTQSQLGFVPYPYTDFIFTPLAEEGGLVAGFSLLLLYGLLFWRLAMMATECRHERDQLVIMGVFTLIAFQVTVNIGVALGLAPVTGITLPLISYGGTSLLSTILALSLAYVTHRDRFKDM